MAIKNQDCFVIENENIELLVPQSIGPRILSLRYNKGENLFAELPNVVSERPDGNDYHFYGGHRLWISPEHPIESFDLDDQEVEIVIKENGVEIRKSKEKDSGFEKVIRVQLDPDTDRLTLTHQLINWRNKTIERAIWSITQFKTGGIAILPQNNEETGLLPNRVISLWPYSDITSTKIDLGNKYLSLKANFCKPFKIGFSNPRGWLAYWVEGLLFVKKAVYDESGEYGDFGCSS